MRKVNIFCLLLLFVMGAGSCRAQFDGSVLWEISGNGLDKPSYILGTYHTLQYAKVAEYNPALEKVIDDVGQVIVEVLYEEMQENGDYFLEISQLPPGVTYEGLLGEEDYSRFRERFRKVAFMDFYPYSTFKPMTVITVYMQLLDARSGNVYVQEDAVDVYVQTIAKKEGKELAGLETLEKQMTLLMDYFSVEEQLAILVECLENDEEMLRHMKESREAYLAGSLDEKIYWQGNPAGMDDEKYMKVFNDDRNDEWMKKLPSMIHETPSLIAVGALHLTGDRGLLKQFRELGYTVRKVK